MFSQGFRLLVRYGRLPLDRQLLVLEAAVWVIIARLLLILIPFRQVARLIGGVDQWHEPPGPATSDPRAQAVGWAVTVVARRLAQPRVCLPQALAARWMLRRRRLAAQVCFGVALKNEGIHAHAWVVSNGGVVCGGPAATGFTPIAALGEGV